jgi:hypothetical protein
VSKQKIAKPINLALCSLSMAPQFIQAQLCWCVGRRAWSTENITGDGFFTVALTPALFPCDFLPNSRHSPRRAGAFYGAFHPPVNQFETCAADL